MRHVISFTCVASVVLVVFVRGAGFAQEEVYHPGETYDSLQAGHDAHLEAEAQRRALIGRQIMLEEQIQAQNTWSDPQDKYRPVRPESYGPIRPSVYAGPTLADVYAYGPSGAVYYTPKPACRRRPPAAERTPPPFRSFNPGRVCRAIFGVILTTVTCGSRSGT